MSGPFPEWRQLTETSQRREYKSSAADAGATKSLHFGQRKLLLSEIEYLAYIVESRKESKDRPLLVVYAGAAPGLHLPYLFSLFPAVSFILIDPAKFIPVLLTMPRGERQQLLELHEGYCTRDICAAIREKYRCSHELHLISDIRSESPLHPSNWAATQIIMRDNEMQREWLDALGAASGLLKFHPPYPPAEGDPSDKTPANYQYLHGILLWGVWAPRSSTELRLLVHPPYTGDLAVYSCKSFEEKCYFYNTNDRYASDVRAERDILDRYLRLVPGRYISAVEMSADISRHLKMEQFLPLDVAFTEDNARFFALLYFTRIKSLPRHYSELCKEATRENIMKWLQQKETRPSHFIFSKKGLKEAYGIISPLTKRPREQ